MAAVNPGTMQGVNIIPNSHEQNKPNKTENFKETDIQGNIECFNSLETDANGNHNHNLLEVKYRKEYKLQADNELLGNFSFVEEIQEKASLDPKIDASGALDLSIPRAKSLMQKKKKQTDLRSPESPSHTVENVEVAELDFDRENVNSELNDVLETIKQLEEKENSQSCDLFLNDIARLVPKLRGQDCRRSGFDPHSRQEIGGCFEYTCVEGGKDEACLRVDAEKETAERKQEKEIVNVLQEEQKREMEKQTKSEEEKVEQLSEVLYVTKDLGETAPEELTEKVEETKEDSPELDDASQKEYAHPKKEKATEGVVAPPETEDNAPESENSEKNDKLVSSKGKKRKLMHIEEEPPNKLNKIKPMRGTKRFSSSKGVL